MEEEEESCYINHPLENELVLRNLAKYIRRRDLLRFRLVCKDWNLITLSRVRSEFLVRLDEASLGKYSSLSQFLSLLLSSDQIPFGSFLLLNVRLENALLQKLFAICGPLIKSLRIELHHFDILDIYGLREILLRRAPNIQVLSLEGSLPEEVMSFPKLFANMAGCVCEDNSLSANQPVLPNIRELHVEGRRMHPNFFIDLLRCCPNLKTLKSNKNWGPDRSSLVIRALRDSGNFGNLSCLNLDDVNKAHFLILLALSEKGMRLKDFSFKVLDAVEGPLLQKMLELQSHSLISLSLGEVSGSNENVVLVLPKMPRLRKLNRTAVCRPEILLGPFSFATTTPVLEDLCVQAFADEIIWGEYFGDVNLLFPCLTLRRLRLPANLNHTERLDKLGRMFPNVTEVCAETPRNSVLQFMWSVWPELRELTLILSAKNCDIDAIFTGIPEESCDLLLRSCGRKEGEGGNDYVKDVETLRVGPSIASLKRLRKLYIETTPIFLSENLFVCDTEPTCFLTDISGYFGLAFLPNLEDVSISCCEITEDCCHHLAKVLAKFTKIFVSARNHVPVFECDELQ